ncbi:MAG TPA: hypothetical protein VEC36_05805 [Patescibacteria group bacterium]|nr:hypothetical protein [Patescibacteria group bacterium]
MPEGSSAKLVKKAQIYATPFTISKNALYTASTDDSNVVHINSYSDSLQLIANIPTEYRLKKREYIIKNLMRNNELAIITRKNTDDSASFWGVSIDIQTGKVKQRKKLWEKSKIGVASNYLLGISLSVGNSNTLADMNLQDNLDAYFSPDSSKIFFKKYGINSDGSPEAIVRVFDKEFNLLREEKIFYSKRAADGISSIFVDNDGVIYVAGTKLEQTGNTIFVEKLPQSILDREILSADFTEKPRDLTLDLQEYSTKLVELEKDRFLVVSLGTEFKESNGPLLGLASCVFDFKNKKVLQKFYEVDEVKSRELGDARFINYLHLKNVSRDGEGNYFALCETIFKKITTSSRGASSEVTINGDLFAFGFSNDIKPIWQKKLKRTLIQRAEQPMMEALAPEPQIVVQSQGDKATIMYPNAELGYDYLVLNFKTGKIGKSGVLLKTTGLASINSIEDAVWNGSTFWLSGGEGMGLDAARIFGVTFVE